jgi:hypothetical protein
VGLLVFAISSLLVKRQSLDAAAASIVNVQLLGYHDP